MHIYIYMQLVIYIYIYIYIINLDELTYSAENRLLTVFNLLWLLYPLLYDKAN